MRYLLVVIGILIALAIIYAIFWYAAPKHWLIKAELIKLTTQIAKRAGVETLIVPKNRYANHAFVGQIKKGHPRILFTSENAYGQLRKRYAEDAKYRRLVDGQAKGKGLQNAIVAWVCRKDRDAGRFAMNELLRLNLKEPSASDQYGEALDFALAYDLLGNLPDWDDATRSRVELQLANYVRSGLRVLNGNSASMWHSRTVLASVVWVAAVVLDGPFADLAELQRSAQAHFIATLRAVALSEGWPEGYSYWINVRAFLLGTACAAHMNGVEAPELNAMVRRIIERIWLWTVHGTEPIGRFHLFGDTGPRNDLKDETQRVVDLFTLITGYPSFRDYSRYLTGLYPKAGYYRQYRWLLPLLRGDSMLDFASSDALFDLSVFDKRLPTSDIFGRDSLGQVFIRSDWGPDATFISFQAGDAFTHHQHYQAGHFTITKKAPLAITSGTYGKYFEEHRLNYYIRTVAANSILVLKPGEKVRPNRFFVESVADGGQRIVMPTGSAVLSVEDWEANLYTGRHYEGGRITAFENSDPRFVYIGSDLTDAYNNTRYDENGNDGKVSEIKRQMVYVKDDDLLLVYDRVVSTDASYTKKWLLHSWGRPETNNETVLVGMRNNGILETSDARAWIRNGEGVLEVLRLLPENAVMRKVGGPDYRYYVEVDGDDSDLDGRNMTGGAKEKPWYDSGMWRIEIQPAYGRREDQFLVALIPRVAGVNKSTKVAILPAQGAVAVTTPSVVVLFRDHGAGLGGRIQYKSPAGGKRLHVLTGLSKSREIQIEIGGAVRVHRTTREGTVVFETGDGPSRTVVIKDLD